MIPRVERKVLLKVSSYISLIIASNMPNLLIQGQAMNIVHGNGSSRQQWSGAPRGTIISVLERAQVRDDTMSSTTSTDRSDPSDISLINLAKRIDPERKNETYVLPNAADSSSPNCEILNKPLISDLVVEDFDTTLTTRPKLLENRSMSTSDDCNLLEGLTTGRFDAKNKLVGKPLSPFFENIEFHLQLLRTVSNPELHTIEEVSEETMIRSFKLTRSLSDLYDINPPILVMQDSTLTSTQFSINKSRNESFEETGAALKHSSSEPDLHLDDVQDNDDDDVWCNPEDEDNLEHRVKIDQERLEQLREMLGSETLQMLLDVAQVSETFQTEFPSSDGCFRIEQ